MANPTVVLASASPRRVELLHQLGIRFEQIVSTAEEPAADGADPQAHVLESARLKAEAVAAQVHAARPAAASEAVLVIGADTVVCIDDQVLGKPSDPEDAARTLRRLAGREHTVCTGIALVGPGTERVQSACEVTRVRLSSMSDAAITAYVDSGEPLDKAGSYAIQGRGGRFVESVQGCYYTVVGLPLARLCTLLESAGYDLDPTQDPG